MSCNIASFTVLEVVSGPGVNNNSFRSISIYLGCMNVFEFTGYRSFNAGFFIKEKRRKHQEEKAGDRQHVAELHHNFCPAQVAHIKLLIQEQGHTPEITDGIADIDEE